MAYMARAAGGAFVGSPIGYEAAAQARAEVVWTEDLNDGQDYGGIFVKNPFR